MGLENSTHTTVIPNVRATSVSTATITLSKRDGVEPTDPQPLLAQLISESSNKMLTV